MPSKNKQVAWLSFPGVVTATTLVPSRDRLGGSANGVSYKIICFWSLFPKLLEISLALELWKCQKSGGGYWITRILKRAFRKNFCHRTHWIQKCLHRRPYLKARGRRALRRLLLRPPHPTPRPPVGAEPGAPRRPAVPALRPALTARPGTAPRLAAAPRPPLSRPPAPRPPPPAPASRHSSPPATLRAEASSPDSWGLRRRRGRRGSAASQRSGAPPVGAPGSGHHCSAAACRLPTAHKTLPRASPPPAPRPLTRDEWARPATAGSPATRSLRMRLRGPSSPRGPPTRSAMARAPPARAAGPPQRSPRAVVDFRLAVAVRPRVPGREREKALDKWRDSASVRRRRAGLGREGH